MKLIVEFAITPFVKSAINILAQEGTKSQAQSVTFPTKHFTTVQIKIIVYKLINCNYLYLSLITYFIECLVVVYCVNSCWVEGKRRGKKKPKNHDLVQTEKGALDTPIQHPRSNTL